MGQLENYHYASYLFSLALLSDKVDLTREIKGTGIQREVYYNVSSPDKKYNETFSFFHLPKSKNPYKRELYNLLSYIFDVKGFNSPKEIKNDDEMLRRYLYLINEVLHMNDVKISFCFNQEEFNKTINQIGMPYQIVSNWRIETEKNFIPMCREHIILVSTECLIAEILKNQNKVNQSQIEASMDNALSMFGFSQEKSREMRMQSELVPPDDLPQPQ